MMTKKIPIFLCALFFLTNLHAFTTDDVLKIRNDKEAVISSFSKKEKDRIMEKYNTKEIQTITDVFYETVLDFLNDENKQCEADFYSRLIAAFSKADIAHSKDAIDGH